MAALLALLLLPSAPARAAEPAARPNVILIVLDAARADRLSGYGYPKHTTPRLDRLAAEGAVFLNNFSQGANTQTSMPRIFSSRHYSLRIFDFDEGWFTWGIRQETPETVTKIRDAGQAFLPEMLSAAGYHTAVVSDHHLFTRESKLARMFDKLANFNLAWTESSFQPILDSATLWIQESAATGRPFFLYVHVLAPHASYPPTVVDPRFLAGYPPGKVDAVRRRAASLEKTDRLSDDDLAIYSALYDGKLRRADDMVGSLLDAVETAGLKANTLIVVTADHGENLGEHGRLIHNGPFWDSVTHVPLILALPGAIPAGRRVASLTGSVDIVPTILELCGLRLPSGK